MEEEEAKASVDKCHQSIIVIEGNQVDCNDSYYLDWPGLAWHATSGWTNFNFWQILFWKWTFQKNIFRKYTFYKYTLEKYTCTTGWEGRVDQQSSQIEAGTYSAPSAGLGLTNTLLNNFCQKYA